jgi:hypothetical protein
MQAVTVKERPVLFSGPMVRAILEGRKTMTRRVIKPQPQVAPEGDNPYGNRGDRLWVRETWNSFRELTDVERAKQSGILDRFHKGKIRDISAGAMELPVGTGVLRAIYAADFGDWAFDPDSDLHWRPSIFMPRALSRISLEITDVRVERVQDISEEDAKAEGIGVLPLQSADDPSAWWQSAPGVHQDRNARGSFIQLWDSINAKRGYGWIVNPWIWVISFKQMPSPEAQRSEAESQ